MTEKNVPGTDPLDRDSDNDGIGDGYDAFPTDADETRDSDEDRIGDTMDLDDDNDGLSDTEEEFWNQPIGCRYR